MKTLGILICFMALSPSHQNQDIHSTKGGKRFNQQRNAVLIEMLAVGKQTPEGEEQPEYWLNLAHEELRQRVQLPLNTNRAKNVIFFLGDGMSITTMDATRIRKGQLKGKPGEEEQLAFEKFPYMALSKTYCANAQVPDSACTSTAFMCGVKANIVTLGVSAKVNFDNCTQSMKKANHVSSIMDWAQKAGKSTGFITTTTLTHATPAGGYAHVANRFWESDADIAKLSKGINPSDCIDISQQLITQNPGKKFNVIMGGGMGKLLPNTVRDAHGEMGERADGRNLLSKWKSIHPKGVMVVDRSGLLQVDVQKVDHIMGIFASGLMDYHAVANRSQQPSLEEMTEVALKLLSKHRNGYVILIEGGLIDMGNHLNIPGKSTDETLEFEKAIQKARSMTNPNDTLIVVSSDHAHPLSIAGFPGRGNDILGLDKSLGDANGLPYATLNYAVGPEQYLDANGNRLDLTGMMDKENPMNIHPSYIHSQIGNHAGDDVGVYASGPYEHLFRGVLQQNTLPHLMAYASCIGDGPTMCNSKH